MPILSTFRGIKILFIGMIICHHIFMLLMVMMKSWYLRGVRSSRRCNSFKAIKNAFRIDGFHKDELRENWLLAKNYQELFDIEPSK